MRTERENYEEGGFSFISLHPWSKYTFVDHTNKEGMYERKLNWKKRSFKALKATMTTVQS